jgi:hypothetical protein
MAGAKKETTFIQEASLIGGPQDGSRVKAVGGWIPRVIYVGPKWLGDGFSAWAAERSERFPVCYVLSGYDYRFKGWRTWVRP